MSEHEDRLARAGEFVLGLLEGEAHAAAERDIETDPLFRDAVDRLAGHLRNLDATAAPDPVPAQMWAEIAARIDAVRQEPQPAGAKPPAPANQNAKAWQKMAMAATVLGALGIGYLSGAWTARTQNPVVLIVLQTPANEPGAVFEAFADNSVRVVPLENFTVPDGQIMQVWTLYDTAVGPVSLGTMQDSRITEFGGRPFPIPVADQLYEITLEPAPGSPTGKPTGPILVKGFARVPAT